MDLKLNQSRERFFQETREPRANYWLQPGALAGADPGARKVSKEMLAWDPLADRAQSNCPILHKSMQFLVAAVDPRWKAKAQNVFAGRTFDTDDIAWTLTSSKRDGAFIAISDEFSKVLFAYSAMWSYYMSYLDVFRSSPEMERLAAGAEMRKQFDEIINSFQKRGNVAFSDTFLTFLRADHVPALDDLCWFAETWVIAHELSHQISDDQQKKRSKEAAKYLNAIRGGSKTHDWRMPHNVNQRMEFDADLMATMIMAMDQSGRRPIPAGVKNCAIIAATIALIAIGHYRNEWECEPHQDTHPGVIDRIDHLLTVFCEQSGLEEDHPHHRGQACYQVAGTLRAYANWCRSTHDSNSEDEDPMAAIVINRLHFRLVAEGERPNRI